MKKILLILTGGTIGSATSGGIIDVSENEVVAGETLAGGVAAKNMTGIHSCRLTDNFYRDNYNMYGNTDKVVFEIRRPLNILSENMNPVYWNDLCRTIYSEISADATEKYNGAADNNGGYDGVIIAHGSDTLSYTSALISLMFAHTDIPIILTAANHPLDSDNTNGNRNFAACVSYICGDNLPGVYTIYEDNSECMKVYKAGSICEADGYLDEYHDVTGEVFGVMEGDRFFKNEDYKAPEDYTEIMGISDKLAYNIERILSGKTNMSDNVLFIRPYPGMRYDCITFDKYRPVCVLHGLYHAGTAAVKSVSGENSIISFVGLCNAENIPFYISTVKYSEAAVYASAKEIMSAGAIPMYETNYEKAYAMLVILAAGAD